MSTESLSICPACLFSQDGSTLFCSATTDNEQQAEQARVADNRQALSYSDEHDQAHTVSDSPLLRVDEEPLPKGFVPK